MELNEQHLNFLQNSDVFFNLKFIRKKSSFYYPGLLSYYYLFLF